MAEPGAGLATKQEEELGRGFTDEEARRVRTGHEAAGGAAHRRASGGEHPQWTDTEWRGAWSEQRRTCGALVASRHSLDQKVYQAQHDLAWLFPNMGGEQLTTDLVG